MLKLRPFLKYCLTLSTLYGVLLKNIEEIEVRIASNCYYDIYNPNEYLTYVIQWDGESPGSMECKLGFRGDGGDGSGYIVCVEAERFYIQGPGISVKFQSESFSRVTREKVYKYNESPTRKFCSDVNKYLSVIVDANEKGFGAAPEDTSRSYFTLRVTATPTYSNSGDYGPNTGAIIAVIIAMLGLIGFCICCYKCRKAAKLTEPNDGENDDDDDDDDGDDNYGDDGTHDSNRRVGPVHHGFSSNVQERTTVPSAPPSIQLHNEYTYQPSSSTTDEGDGHHPNMNPETSFQFSYPTSVNGSHVESVRPSDIELDTLGSGRNKRSSIPEIPPPSYSEVMNNR